MPLKKMMNTMRVQKAHDQRQAMHQNILRFEAKVGGTVFGPIPQGHRREFFCLDEHTWVWYEEWKDKDGITRTMTTRYDVRPNGIVKIQDNHPSRYVSAEEGRNLHRAVNEYNRKVDAALTKFL